MLTIAGGILLAIAILIALLVALPWAAAILQVIWGFVIFIFTPKKQVPS